MCYDSNKMRLGREASRALNTHLASCDICPRLCRADRTKGKTGYCRAGLNPAVYSYAPHHGEEPVLSGSKGSGTIFFSRCNMKCAYCQNYQFSQLDEGVEVSTKALAEMMLHLQGAGCHNINLVSPTHYVPQIAAGLAGALESGLEIPVVYNSGGYELEETLKLLDGLIDIYMPDMRYADNAMAERYSDAKGYVEHNRRAVVEMQRQVGDLVLDEMGIARRGLIIRLLVLPGDISGTAESLKFIKDHISPNASLSIMSQYYPTFKAYNFSEISRGVTPDEYSNVVDEARLLGLNNGWVQEGPAKEFWGTNIKPKREIK